MKKILLLATSMGLFLLVASVAMAHGGSYTGPGGQGTGGGFAPGGTGTPGPGPGPGGTGTGTTPGGAGTGTTGGGTPGGTPGVGPVRPGGGPTGPAGPVGPSGAGATGVKKNSSDANTTWAAWWFFNDDRFLNLKNKIRATEQETDTADLFYGKSTDSIVKVPAKKIREKVNPALEFALKDPYYDTRAAAVIALAKTGFAENLGHIMSLVTDDDHRVRESCCLAMGVLGNKEAIPFLIEVMNNAPSAQKKMGREKKDILTRTRAFAALAIGLIGYRNAELSDTQAVSALTAMLTSSADVAQRDLTVAPIVALGLMKSKESVPALIAYAKNEDNPAWERAYAITSLSKIGDPAATPLLVECLRDKQNAVVQSAAMGLGILAKSDDAETIKALQRQMKSSRDLAAKNFAILSLAKIGGEENRNLLAGNIAKGNSFEKTFSALGLAIYFTTHKDDPFKIEIAKSILSEFNSTKNPDERGAFAVSLGIMEYEPAGDDILKVLEDGGQASLRANLCTALGLMRFEKSVKVIQDIVKDKGDIDLRRAAAIALGLLGDKGAIDHLKKEIENSENSIAVHGAVVQGLGFIGDVSAVDTLTKMVYERDNYKDATRAFASVALGLLGDKDEIPVLFNISENNNYLIRTDALIEVLTIL